MSDIRLIGLTSIRIGDVGATGVMCGTLETITGIVPDSAHLIIEAPTMTDLYVEEETLPDVSVPGTSKKTVEFATRDVGGKVLKKAFAGIFNATSLVWSASTAGSITIEECAVELKSKVIAGKYVKIEIPRATIHASADLKFTKTESGQVAFSCDVMVPSSSTNIPAIVITSA